MLRAAAAVLPLYGGVLLIYAAFTTLLPGYHLRGNAQDLFQGLPNHPGLGLEILVLLWAGVQAPLVEETLFRGILFQGLRQFFARWIPYQGAVLAGAIVSGVIFGLAHSSEPHTWPILIFLGIALAYIFQLARSIYASALVHAIINGAATLLYFHAQ
jgi:membrane protease YdiL (CAAX protease family)